MSSISMGNGFDPTSSGDEITDATGRRIIGMINTLQLSRIYRAEVCRIQLTKEQTQDVIEGLILLLRRELDVAGKIKSKH